MYISTKDWKAYIKKLSALNEKAAEEVTKYVQKNGFADRDSLIAFCYAVSDKYGSGSATLSALMYDAVVEMSGVFYDPAEVADTASYHEVAKTVNGVLKTSQNVDELAGAVSRLVKKAGCDTTLKNAYRDRAQYAWIPSGDTCAFCLGLAANGWVDISARKVRKGYKHAEHIHSNCDCTYAIRFNENDGVEGYAPEDYMNMINEAAENQGLLGDYNSVESAYWSQWQQMNPEVINAVRRQNYARNREKIRAQQNSAAEKRKELESSTAEESKV